MLKSLWHIVPVFSLIIPVLAFPAWLEPTRQIAAHGSLAARDGKQNEDDFDPDDLSFINKLAAIGDSYSAGIGAGDRLGSILNALDPTSGEWPG